MPNKDPRPDGFLALMRNRDYALLWSGQLVSEIGNRFHWIAVSLWVYSISHSATSVSLAIASMFIGGLLVGLWAGVLVDRFNRKSILIISDLVRAVLVALIPALIQRSIWLAYADLAVISMAGAFFRPAMFAVIPQVVGQGSLLPANAFFSAMDTGTEIVGPALAGVLAFSYGYPSLLYLDSMTYLVSALCVLGMSIAPVRVDAPGDSERQTIWGGVKEGLRYIQRDRLQRGLFALIFPAVLVSSGLNALQTPLAKGMVGVTDSQFGTFNSVWGVGFVTASLILGWYGSRVGKSIIILGGYFMAFVFTSVMGLSTSFRVLLLTGFAVGFSNTLYYVGVLTVLMEHTPRAVIGRVMSTRQAAISTVQVLSPLIFGFLADIMGIREAIVSMGLFAAGGTVLVVLRHPILLWYGRGQRERSGTERIFGIRRALIGPVNPSFDAAQQERLNIASIGILALSLLALAYRNQVAYEVLGLLSVVSAVGFLGYLARRNGLIR